MIPLSVPNLAGNEWAYVKDCLDTGWISSVGAYVTRFEGAVARFSGAQHGVATVNGTTALHIALMLAGVQPGDAVIVPNLTFVASANAIRHASAEPVLVDVDAQTWQMDLDLLAGFLAEAERRESGLFWRGRRLAALMPVHVLGNMCDMTRLMSLAGEYGLPVVEDSTEALGCWYQGRHAGTFGLMGTFSFNGNKIISTGGGGMIVSDDAGLARHAKHLTTTAKAVATEYFHDEVGYNYRLVNLLAAVGVAQMEQLPGFLQRKKVVDERYRQALKDCGDLSFQLITPGVQPNNWLTTVATADQAGLMAALRAADIDCRPFWVPMNRLPMYAQCTYVQHDDMAGQVYGRCISIPSSTSITDDQQSEVIAVIRKHFSGKAA